MARQLLPEAQAREILDAARAVYDAELQDFQKANPKLKKVKG